MFKWYERLAILAVLVTVPFIAVVVVLWLAIMVLRM
jgi:hypothetical protein